MPTTAESHHKTGDSGAASVAEESLTFDHQGSDGLELAKLLTGRSMARRLPSLIRRTFSLAWQVDHRTVIVLLFCQVASGVTGALGLFATTRALSVLLDTARDTADLADGIPAVLLLASTAGLRALLGIAIQALSSQLSPRISREAEYQMLEAATNAEQAAYDHPGFNERFQRCLSRVRTALVMTLIQLGLIRDLRKICHDFSRAMPRSTGARAAD